MRLWSGTAGRSRRRTDPSSLRCARAASSACCAVPRPFLFLVFGQTACVFLLLGLLRGADASSTALQLHAAQPTADLAGQIEADEALLSALASCGAWPALLAAFDDLAAESKARRPCLKLAAQAARATDSDRASELAALAAAA
mmetsp:Transcript_21494/g.68417  ORF Transcript_21494/g.68417 Transcript_21494/m.68417 type:complete len:143 (+) Transcript_21494:1429-1857(+)